MSSESIIALVIISIVAFIMLLIGIVQVSRKEAPVGFYNLIAPPKSEEISNIPAWNIKHGLLWIIYALCIEAGYWLGYFAPTDILQAILAGAGVVLPLPIMVICHIMLVKKYHK